MILFEYQQHPLSAAFPAMSALEFAELVNDIRANGQRHPVMLYDDQVLDGWHRYRACLHLGIRPKVVYLDQRMDPVAYVESVNLHRRHLTSTQRAVAVTTCREWARTGRPEKERTSSPFSTTEEMAEAADVSERTIEQTKAGVEAGLGDAMRDGKVSAKKAAQLAKLPPEERRAALEERAPKPSRPKPATGGELEKLRAEVEALKAENEQLREALAEAQSENHHLQQENDSLRRVAQADDKSAASVAEAARFRELARVTEERNRGLQGQNHSLARDAKRWMGKFLRLEKRVKAQGATPAPEPEEIEPGPEPPPPEEPLGLPFDDPAA